jgi:hypothetical protein
VIAEPPVELGAVHEIVPAKRVPEPAVKVTAVGAPGTLGVVKLALADEAGELPTELVAITLKVYDVPAVSPVTLQEFAEPLALQVAPPGLAITV